jgi:hypothetical protein
LLISPLATAAPRYVAAFIVNIAMSAMTIIFATIIRFYLKRLNAKLDEGEEVKDVRADENVVEAREEHGLPGRATQRGFRFLL